VVDTDAGTYDEHDFIVKVDDVGDSTKFHGITQERANKGCAFAEAYAPLKEALMAGDTLVVGHNLSFDLRMIQAECLRNGLPYVEPSSQYCTMKHGTDVCNIMTPKGYAKYPKLEELFTHYFKTSATNLHNSLFDSYATLCCFYKMVLFRDPPAKFLILLTGN
jgi:DNA polymerase-3 subunit epsilon